MTPPSLRFGAPWPGVKKHRGVGRDVGLAKSGRARARLIREAKLFSEKSSQENKIFVDCSAESGAFDRAHAEVRNQIVLVPTSQGLRRGQPLGVSSHLARARQSVATAASCSCSKRGGINWTGFECPLRSACFVGRRSCGNALRATSPRPAMGRASLLASQLSSRLTVAQRERLD